jgi:hypothetical protein
LTFAIHVIRGFSEYVSTGCLGARKEYVDLCDSKHDGVRPGTLQCCRSSVGMSAGFGDDDGPVAVRELTAMIADSETFGERQSRCEPLDGFADVGVVEDGYDCGVWRRAVLLQHGLEGHSNTSAFKSAA